MVVFWLDNCEMNKHKSLAYKIYIKEAERTRKYLSDGKFCFVSAFAAVCFDILAVTVLKTRRTFKTQKILPLLSLGAAAGLAAGLAFEDIRYSRYKKFSRLEAAEGYSPRVLALTEQLLSKKQLSEYAAANVFLRCGNADKAIQVLSGIEPKKFDKKPRSAHLYYTFMIKARLQRGEVQEAKRLYNEGFFFLQTYINNPVCWHELTITLGIFYYYIGDFDTGLKFLDRFLLADYANDDDDSDHRIMREFLLFEVLYWMAMCFAALGRNAVASDLINLGRDLYTTDYYRQCAEKLLADMEDDMKGKNTKEYEKIS